MRKKNLTTASVQPPDDEVNPSKLRKKKKELERLKASLNNKKNDLLSLRSIALFTIVVCCLTSHYIIWKTILKVHNGAICSSNDREPLKVAEVVVWKTKTEKIKPLKTKSRIIFLLVSLSCSVFLITKVKKERWPYLILFTSKQIGRNESRHRTWVISRDLVTIYRGEYRPFLNREWMDNTYQHSFHADMSCLPCKAARLLQSPPGKPILRGDFLRPSKERFWGRV